ncbi:MAG: IPT/TIG domain-containing protein [Chloroflexota bacterium]
MKFNYSRLIPLAVILAMLMALIPITPVSAAGVLSVTPGTIVNNISNTITISGTGFDNTAVVLLNGSALATSFGNDQTLTATVPTGLSAGSYTVTVTMTGTVVTGSATLTIADPTPIPPTPIPTATTGPLPFARPQFVVRVTKALGKVQTGKEFTLKVVVENMGQATAYNAQAAFTSTDLVPTKTGGVAALGAVPFDEERDASQTFYVATELVGKTILTVDMTMTYYDDKGATYSDKFTLSVPVNGTSTSGGGGSIAATATPTGVKSSQLVISSYSADVDPLQPGEQFALKMSVQNVGNAKAQRITMIIGGGTSGTSGGTPQPGGVSGGSGDFANFAPVGASNVQSIGDLGVGDKADVSQNLIVNVSTNPGAYPMKVTFSYLNDKGEVINDEQVITLLVYSLPSVDVSFYRVPDPFFVGQPGALPIQVVNLGKRLAVLGNIKLSAGSGQIDNGTSLVGSLDAGGYFTLDSMFTAEQSGPQTLDVVIEYVDDFNQARTLTKKLEIEVQEGFIEPTPDPSLNGGGGGGEIVTQDETTLHKIFRFIKGLFGLDSAWPVWQAPGGGAPIEQPIQSPAGGGKG